MAATMEQIYMLKESKFQWNRASGNGNGIFLEFLDFLDFLGLGCAELQKTFSPFSAWYYNNYYYYYHYYYYYYYYYCCHFGNSGSRWLAIRDPPLVGDKVGGTYHKGPTVGRRQPTTAQMQQT